MENEELKDKVRLETTEHVIYYGEFVDIKDNFIQIKNPKYFKADGRQESAIDSTLWEKDKDIIYNLNMKYVIWYYKYKRDITE